VAVVRDQASAWLTPSEFDIGVAKTTHTSAAVAPPRNTPISSSVTRTATDRGRRPAVQPPPVDALPEAVGASAQSSGKDSQNPPREAGLRSIDLGLRGNMALTRAPEEPPHSPRSEPSVARLREELEARDAERGLSRASPVVASAYQVASSAPENGMATFEVTTDATGAVVAVDLVGPIVDRARWLSVLRALRQRLKDRRLRGAREGRGMVVRIVVERGEFAKRAEERFRQRRGAALGEEPTHPGVPRNESTRARLDKGRIRPTFGVGGPVSHPTRVRLLEVR